MDPLASFNSINDKVKERDQVITEYHSTATGFGIGCSLLEVDIKSLILKSKHFDQELSDAERQVHIMNPWTEIGRNMLDQMYGCTHLLGEHEVCRSKDLENITQKEIIMTQAHSIIYDEEKKKLQESHPASNEKRLGLKCLKIKDLDLSIKLKIFERTRTQQYEVKRQIFYNHIITLAKHSLFNYQVSKNSVEIKQKQGEDRILMKQILEKEKARQDREVRQQMSSFQRKFSLPHVEFTETNDALLTNSGEGEETRPELSFNTRDCFGRKRPFDRVSPVKEFNATKVHILENNEMNTVKEASNVKILNCQVVTPSSAFPSTPRRQNPKDPLEEFKKFISRKTISRKSSAITTSQQSNKTDSDRNTHEQERYSAEGFSQNQQNFATDTTSNLRKPLYNELTDIIDQGTGMLELNDNRSAQRFSQPTGILKITEVVSHDSRSISGKANNATHVKSNAQPATGDSEGNNINFMKANFQPGQSTNIPSVEDNSTFVGSQQDRNTNMPIVGNTNAATVEPDEGTRIKNNIGRNTNYAASMTLQPDDTNLKNTASRMNNVIMGSHTNRANISRGNTNYVASMTSQPDHITLENSGGRMNNVAIMGSQPERFKLPNSGSSMNVLETNVSGIGSNTNHVAIMGSQPDRFKLSNSESSMGSHANRANLSRIGGNTNYVASMTSESDHTTLENSGGRMNNVASMGSQPDCFKLPNSGGSMNVLETNVSGIGSNTNHVANMKSQPDPVANMSRIRGSSENFINMGSNMQPCNIPGFGGSTNSFANSVSKMHSDPGSKMLNNAKHSLENNNKPAASQSPSVGPVQQHDNKSMFQRGPSFLSPFFKHPNDESNLMDMSATNQNESMMDLNTSPFLEDNYDAGYQLTSNHEETATEAFMSLNYGMGCGSTDGTMFSFNRN